MLTFGGGGRGGRIARRQFLKIGGLALGGLSLPQILRAEVAAGLGSSHKAIIMVYLNGGPPHQDMFDLKPEAPSEVRGEFQPVATRVPGIAICEHMPRLAACMERLVVILPLLDHGLAALVEDLHQRGLDQDVSVVVWGEFGRTPRINERAGRDHWPAVACALLAGGGMRTGQALGATNRLAEEPVARPIHFQDVFATLYHNLGINASTTTITNLNGRPQSLVDDGYQPIREVI